MQIVLRPADALLARFGNQLGALGAQAPVILARALNHEGDKARTQVKRVLVRQTGIKYGMIAAATRTVRAGPKTLEYRVEAKGAETNVGLFGATQRAKGVSAAPWNTRRLFPGTFMVKSKAGLTRGAKAIGMVYRRTSADRLPIEPVFGPNLGRELVKDQSRAAWEMVPRTLAGRVAHEIARSLP